MMNTKSNTDQAQSKPLNHLGIIVDGNRRWATKRGLAKFKGHSQGLKILEGIIEEVFDQGIKYVSLFIFSTDNWRRSPEEVNHLMKLFLKYFNQDSQRLIQRGVRFKIAGRIAEPLSDKVRQAALDLEKNSQHNDNDKTVVLCFNYGGQTEIVDMVKKIVEQDINSEDVDLEMVKNNLYQADVPNIDLIIRTSGEQRISGFQLWRAAYAELCFIDKFWPDFTKQDLIGALDAYRGRHRRFGGD